MRVLITGGNGFIGSHLADELVKRKESVSILDLHFGPNSKNIECKKIRGDVREYGSVRKAMRGIDVVFHFAAVSRVIWGQDQPLNCWRSNVLGTVNVLEAARKANTKPFLFYGSSREVYGEPQYLPVNESHPKNPKSVYGVSKLCAEKATLSYHNAFGMRTLVFRFSNVYGSHRDILDRVIPKFMLRALQNEPITLYGGDQVLDFSFVDDVISGILHAYDKICIQADNLAGEDFHFVTGRGVSVGSLAKKIIRLCDSSSRIIREDLKGFEVGSFTGDPLKASKLLDYAASVRLEEGLQILKERLESRIV